MCTDFLIAAADHTHVNGRSMEFGADLKSQLLVQAPGTAMKSHGPNNAPGYAWTVKYGYVGLNVFDLSSIIVDGMNTQGLSMGCLWLPGSRYPMPTNPALALALDDFCGWVLGSFATVAEVRSALEGGQVQVWEGKIASKLLPLHFPIHDAGGHSLVVEFIDGTLQLHDNPVAVLTNDPPFPEQLTNLGGYSGLSPWDSEPVFMGGKRFKPSGHGSGMRGLPGDSTPPSRFVRAAYLKHYADKPANSAAACNLAFHILDSVDIPMGTSRSRDELTGQVKQDYTQWIVVKDLGQKIFSTRFYGNMLVYSVNLSTLDFSTAAGKQFPVPTSPTSIDLTPQMNG